MRIVLGSQSPQRFQLLKTVVAEDRFEVLAPASDREPGFEHLHQTADIERRLEHVVDVKFQDVWSQIQTTSGDADQCCIICADTVVVATNADERAVVLGKPPSGDWKPVVAEWFRDYLIGRSHQVWTSVRIGLGDRSHRNTVKSEITLCDIDDEQLSWYLDTEEPLGKAGGYAVQGIAAMFVESIQGSLTNVVGLPMREVSLILRDMLP
ncbi:MAG: Maf family protein [Planctomycetaceae bacterium]